MQSLRTQSLFCSVMYPTHLWACRDASASAVQQRDTEVVDLDSCSVHDLLQLQNCCHSLSQVISRRIAQMPGVMLGASAEAAPNGRLALTTSSLEAHRNSDPISGHRQGWCSLPSHLEGDLGLWQAVQQELFPRPVKTRGGWTDPSCREEQNCAASPSMLSVVTAPSDGGTTKGQRMCARSAHRTQLSQVDTHSQAAPGSNVHHPRCFCCSIVQDKSEDFSTPVSSVCGDGPTAEPSTDSANGRHPRCPHAQGSSIPVCSAVAPIPECNSSLETAGSIGYNASTDTAQPHFGRRCGSAFASSADAPALSFQNVTADATATDIAVSSVQTGTAGASMQLSRSCSSTPPSHGRRKHRKRESGTPPVQYGFPTSPHYHSASISSESAPGSVHAEEQHNSSDRLGLDDLLADKALVRSRRPASAAGPRVPTGLLSASLSKAKSAGTSPHVRGILSVTAGHGPVLGASYHARQGTTCPEPLNCLERRHIADRDQTSQHASAPDHAAFPKHGLGVSGESSSAIPQVLMAEMAYMGFHRPLRVGSKQELTQSGSPEQA